MFNVKKKGTLKDEVLVLEKSVLLLWLVKNREWEAFG
jgi:hypothetical protein